MNGQRGSDHRACRDAGAIAFVPHPMPGNAFANAAFARLSIAEEGCPRAHQAIVVQRLHHRGAFSPGGVIHTGRSQRECIVKVHHIGLVLADQAAHLGMGPSIPDRRSNQAGAPHLPHFIVMQDKRDRLVAECFEQAASE